MPPAEAEIGLCHRDSEAVGKRQRKGLSPSGPYSCQFRNFSLGKQIQNFANRGTRNVRKVLTMQLDQSSVMPPFCFGHCACCGGSEACVCRENRLTTNPTAPGTRGLRAKPAEGAGCRPDGLAAIALLTPFLSGFRTGCPEVSMVMRVPRSLFCA